MNEFTIEDVLTEVFKILEHSGVVGLASIVWGLCRHKSLRLPTYNALQRVGVGAEDLRRTVGQHYGFGEQT